MDTRAIEPLVRRLGPVNQTIDRPFGLMSLAPSAYARMLHLDAKGDDALWLHATHVVGVRARLARSCRAGRSIVASGTHVCAGLSATVASERSTDAQGMFAAAYQAFAWIRRALEGATTSDLVLLTGWVLRWCRLARYVDGFHTRAFRRRPSWPAVRGIPQRHAVSTICRVLDGQLGTTARLMEGQMDETRRSTLALAAEALCRFVPPESPHPVAGWARGLESRRHVARLCAGMLLTTTSDVVTSDPLGRPRDNRVAELVGLLSVDGAADLIDPAVRCLIWGDLLSPDLVHRSTCADALTRLVELGVECAGNPDCSCVSFARRPVK
jgi:hypothetical protein